MAHITTPVTVNILFLAGQNCWEEWYENIKLLATLTGIWDFVNPELSDTKIRKFIRTSTEVTEDKQVESSSNIDPAEKDWKDIDPIACLEQLGQLSAMIHDSIYSEVRVEMLKAVNKDGRIMVDGIHIARRMLVYLVGKFRPAVFRRATERRHLRTGYSGNFISGKDRNISSFV